MSSYQLGVIGCGNMAEALLRGAIGANLLPLAAIVAADPSFERRQLFNINLRIDVVADNAVAAACPRVLLAVKPQVMPAVLEEIAPHVRQDAAIVSIAAGVTCDRLDAGLGGKGRIIRVMPNTPMLVGDGMSVLAAGPRAAKEDVESARKLFAASGQAVTVADESLIDAVTAVSGSGPAYFFYLIEAMIAAGVAEGLTADLAKTLAVQTCLGAARLLAETGEPPEGLRARVTSPGGTTQRALETLDAADVKNSLVAAIRAAAARSRELGA